MLIWRRFYSVNDPCVIWDLSVVVQADILLVISKYKEGLRKPKKAIRFSFHTAFMSEGEITLDASDMDAQGGKKKYGFEDTNWSI